MQIFRKGIKMFNIYYFRKICFKKLITIFFSILPIFCNGYKTINRFIIRRLQNFTRKSVQGNLLIVTAYFEAETNSSI